MSLESFINNHRPERFEDVIGQDGVVKSFRTALKDRSSHAFLFTGPSGTGKTTLSRLGARYVKSAPSNIVEIDAATYNGVDDVRALTTTLAYRPLGGNSSKSFIYDECHRLGSPAWTALLKSVEEPPEWVYWFFCTTDVDKVPANIKSRCAVYNLKQVPTTELFDFLEGIADKENLSTSKQIIDLCAKAANGSPRKALSALAVCYNIKDRAEAARLIASEEAKTEGAPFALARLLADGATWKKVQPLLLEMSGAQENPEGIRHTIRAYFTKVVIESNDEKVVCKALRVLDNFSEVCNPSDGLTPIVTAIGRSLFSV